MMIQGNIFRFLSVGLVVVTLAACQTPTAQTPIYTQEELAAERAAQDALVKQHQANNAATSKSLREMQAQFNRVAPRVESAGIKMCEALGIQNYQQACNYQFQMDPKEDSRNAFADGSRIVVAGGMMNFVKNDEELALVLSHEMAHNILQHPQSTQQNAAIGGIGGTLADAFLSSQGFDTQGAFGKIGSNVAVLRYSKGFEAEADYVGMYILANAGYDISNVPNFWRRMSIANPNGIYTGTTHPTTPERYISLNKTIGEIQQKRREGRPLLPDFKPKT